MRNPRVPIPPDRDRLAPWRTAPRLPERRGAANREPGDVTTLRDASVLTQLQQNAVAGKRW